MGTRDAARAIVDIAAGGMHRTVQDVFQEALDLVMARIVPAGTPVGVSVRIGQGTRIELTSHPDTLAAAFPVPVAPAEGTTGAGGAPVAAPGRRHVSVDKEPHGFEGIGLGDSYHGELGEDMEEAVRALIAGFPSILSQTRQGSGVWKRTCRAVMALAGGTLMDRPQEWNRSWMARVEGSWGIPACIREGAGSIPQAVGLLRRCLLHVRACIDAGGYWWPRKWNERGDRPSLLDFIMTCGRDRTFHSPFIEVLGEVLAADGTVDRVPSLVREIAQGCMDASMFLSSLDRRGRVAYWAGVLAFCRWYWARRGDLMTISANRARLASLESAAMLVSDWAAASGNRCLPARFIHPDSAAWATFVRWCKAERGVVIPRGMW